MSSKSKQYALVLAGGKGTRLWPISRENYPKQFVEFIKGESLFQHTIRRLLKAFEPERIGVVASNSYKFHVRNQIEALGSVKSGVKKLLKKHIILEPCPKSTAPAIMLGVKSLGARDADVCFVFPSDHIIEPFPAFKKSLRKGACTAKEGVIVVFGIKPHRADSGYGYILAAGPLGKGYRVRRFIEKPKGAVLKKLMGKKVYWNAGIFGFTVRTLSQQLHMCAPSLYRQWKKPLAAFKEEFPRIRQDSFDYAVMQKTKQAALIEFDARWSDLGSWESVREYFSKASGNVSIGRAEFLNAQDCFAFSRDKLISVIGMRDLLVIEDSDSVLVTRKGYSGKVRELTARLRTKRAAEVQESRTVYRPWGYYTILKEKENYKVKEIGVYPKKSISLQRHRRRSEHWNVVRGTAQVFLKGKTVTIRKNQSVYVPKGEKHRIYNPASKIAVIIEVQIGAYLGEDDITRYSSYET